MSLLDGFKPLRYADWLARVEHELKGESFQDNLVHQYEDLIIQPLYTRGPEWVAPAEDEETFLGEDDHNSTIWQAAEQICFTDQMQAEQVLIDAFESQFKWLTIHHDPGEFLRQLQRTSPIPMNLRFSLLPGSIQVETNRSWKEWLQEAKLHHPFIWSVECDPLGFHFQQGKSPDVAALMSAWLPFIQNAQQVLTDARYIRIDASVAAESGAYASTQLAYLLSLANAYIRLFQEAGVDFYEMVSWVFIQMSTGGHFFAEIAKLKASRILWRNLLEAWDDNYPYLEHPSLHIVTSGVLHTEADEHNNILRSTTAAMSAILGNCDSLHILPYKIPADTHAKRMARNIHHLLRYESHLETYGAMAEGAYYIEELSSKLATEAWELFQSWEAAGGFIAAMEQGLIQRKIEADRNATLTNFKEGKAVLVGVNKYRIAERRQAEILTSSTGITDFPPLKNWNIENALNETDAA